MRNVTEIQQRLIALGYLSPTYLGTDGIVRKSDDGRLGERSIAAYNRWRASKGAGPVQNASVTQLNIDLFPEEQPGAKPRLTPNPVVQAIGSLALDIVLQRFTKGLITVNFLTGYKTFIIGGVLIVLGALELLGWQLPGVPLDPSQGIPTIMTGIGLITGRVGAKTEAGKATGQQ